MRLITIAVLFSLSIGQAGFGEAQTVAVAPGTIVRWPGDQIESCGLGERSWSPLPDGCWYAIDLLTPSGPARLVRRRNGVLEEAAVRVSPYPYPIQEITLQDDSQVNLSAEDLARVRRENSEIGRLWSLSSSRTFELPLAAPLDPLPASGRFGNRRVFNDQPRSPHSGADYAADAGTQVTAVADGRVALTGDFFFPGKSIFVDHGDGLISMYFHLSEIGVAEGDGITRDQVIGRVGQSGRATGPHLHFGLRWHGARIDPGLLIGSTELVSALP